MRITVFLLTAVFLHAHANSAAQTVTLSGKNLTLEQVLTVIKKQSGYVVLSNKGLLDGKKSISMNVSKMPLRELLDRVLKDQPIEYDIQGKTIFLSPKSAVINSSDQQSGLSGTGRYYYQSDPGVILLTGRVVDEKGEPLAGATVRVKGTDKATVTDGTGKFSITANPGDILVISFVGYRQQQIKVQTENSINISLSPSAGSMDTAEVVVHTGYQTMNKARTTGSFEVINSKKFNEQVGTTVLSRLPAIANGLTVVPSRLTGGGTMLLRGSQTINGPMGALIVVDNFPYDGDINNINPNDVESITLLKDAAAASIWGAQAGNGVIVITTKKGKLNIKTTVEATSNLTIMGKPDIFKLPRAGTGDIIEFEQMLFAKGSYDISLLYLITAYQSQVVDLLELERKGLVSHEDAALQLNQLRQHDNRYEFDKHVYQPAINQQYSVSMRGGSHNLGWNLSLGLDRNRTDLDGSFTRGTFRFDNQYKPIKNLTITAGLDFTYSQNVSGKNGYNDIQYLRPYDQLMDETGKSLPVRYKRRQAFIDTIGGGRLLDGKNYLLDEYKYNVNRTTLKNVTGNLGINYSIIPGLTVDLLYRLTVQQVKGRLLHDEQSYFARDMINQFTSIAPGGQITRPVPLGGILDLDDRDVNSHRLRGQVNFSRTFGYHQVTVLVGAELSNLVTDVYRDRYYGYKKDLLQVQLVNYTQMYPGFGGLGGSETIPYNFSIDQSTQRKVSQYTNAQYTFKEKYSFTASARKDGANLFGQETNDKWNLIWSAGSAWEISKERFYRSTLLPSLKLRLTYGFGGNVIPNANSRTTLFYNSLPSPYTGEQRASVSGFQDNNLTWEKIRTINMAIDFGFKNSRINGSVEYYRKNGIDLYGPFTLDPTLGLDRPTLTRNIANTSGNGVELSLRSLNVTGKLTWASDLQFSYYTDKVTDYYDVGQLASNFRGETSDLFEVRVGYPRYSLFTYRFASLDPATGDPLFYLKGKPGKDYATINGTAAFSDLHFNGQLNPKFFGSLGNTLTYKNISLAIRLQYAMGYVFLRESFDYSNARTTLRLHADYSSRWKAPGDEKYTSVPAYYYGEDLSKWYLYSASDVLATKGDHIRLKYINLSYTISKQECPNSPFSQVRIYLIANDLGLLWKANKQGIDPDFPNSIPVPKSFVAGININF